MRNRTGQPVRGTDFWDRQRELDELWHLVDHDSVLLLAPRRVGKTSLLYRLLDEPRDGWRCAYLDVMAAESEQRFVARLVSRLHRLNPSGKIWKQFGDRMHDLLDRVEKLHAGPIEFELSREIANGWQEVGERALKLACDGEVRTLLLVDEFPIFVRRLLRSKNGSERTQLLMHWFRSVRTALSLEDVEVRFLIAGSIGLDGVVSRARMSGTIADLKTFSLGPMSEVDADGLLDILGEVEGIPLPPEIRERVLQRVNWRIPFHLQLVFSQIHRLVRFHDQELTPDLVDVAYEGLLGADNRKEFAHWEERLDAGAWSPQERDLIDAVLAAAARDPEGVSPDTLRQVRLGTAGELDETPLLLSLAHDGYLVLEAGRWRFASSLLRDWWRRWKAGEP
jgi:hypothetical protein